MRAAAQPTEHERPSNPSHWIVGPRFDLGWFVGPGLMAALAGLLLVLTGQDASGPSVGDVSIWVVGVLLVDVAHVYASLYRTYLDPEAWQHHGAKMTWVPLAVAAIGFTLYLASPLWFWRVLAYVAIFHFIKQHEGFVALYVRGGREDPRDLSLAKATVWAGTLGPVLWWHAHLPRQFAWFLEGDLLQGMPPVMGNAAIAMQVPLVLAFLWRRAQLIRQGRPNWMVPALVLTPMLCWNLGIVWTDDDRIFTVTNVFLHGVPYLALVWVAGGRTRVHGWLGASRRSVPPVMAVVVVYYVLLVALAYGEEALWDRLMWHERGWLFGESAGPPLDRLTAAAVAALLTVPQATHYALDRFIWRSGPANPRLAEQLGFGRDRARAAVTGQ